jgi:hypothetical protein
MLQFFDFVVFAFVKLGMKFFCLLLANFHYVWSFCSMGMAKGKILNIAVTLSRIRFERYCG